MPSLCDVAPFKIQTSDVVFLKNALFDCIELTHTVDVSVCTCFPIRTHQHDIHPPTHTCTQNTFAVFSRLFHLHRHILQPFLIAQVWIITSVMVRLCGVIKPHQRDSLHLLFPLQCTSSVT